MATYDNTPWRPKTEIEENPINLSKDAAKAIIPELDRHLASFFVLFHQYQKHHHLLLHLLRPVKDLYWKKKLHLL